ncbi:MAG TPA: Cof-type HAD-IIB family hydrolase [Candidatus Acidoferrum sp.]|nr:Cof-type HAD-IIB family hydrolase [Candidatus Acidoferrum sp.]
MGIRFIALDIDGTLLNSSFQVSPSNRAAIAEATHRGIEVALVTGRRYDFAMPVAIQIDSPLTMIVNNGALVRTKEGQTLLRHLLPKETARRVLEATEPWREATAVVFDRPQANQVVLQSIDWDDPTRGGYYRRNRAYLAEAVPLESCLEEDPIQIMYTGSVASMREAESTLRRVQFAEEFTLAATVYEDRDFSMIDVIHAGVTKGTTLAEWTATRGIAPEEILAIGDNHNDMEMLSFAGIPVVMGNCVAELKQRGWHITGSNDEDGVAAAIERFALAETVE